MGGDWGRWAHRRAGRAGLGPGHGVGGRGRASESERRREEERGGILGSLSGPGQAVTAQPSSDRLRCAPCPSPVAAAGQAGRPRPPRPAVSEAKPSVVARPVAALARVCRVAGVGCVVGFLAASPETSPPVPTGSEASDESGFPASLSLARSGRPWAGPAVAARGRRAAGKGPRSRSPRPRPPFLSAVTSPRCLTIGVNARRRKRTKGSHG